MLTPEREKYLRSLTEKHDPNGTHTMEFKQCMYCIELLAEIDRLRADIEYQRKTHGEWLSRVIVERGEIVEKLIDLEEALSKIRGSNANP